MGLLVYRGPFLTSFALPSPSEHWRIDGGSSRLLQMKKAGLLEKLQDGKRGEESYVYGKVDQSERDGEGH